MVLRLGHTKLGFWHVACICLWRISAAKNREMEIGLTHSDLKPGIYTESRDNILEMNRQREGTRDLNSCIVWLPSSAIETTKTNQEMTRLTNELDRYFNCPRLNVAGQEDGCHNWAAWDLGIAIQATRAPMEIYQAKMMKLKATRQLK